jgi:hypothetical protein
MSDHPDRRRFLSSALTGAGALAAGLTGCDERDARPPVPAAEPFEPGELPPPDKSYVGPNVVLVRFGGGVRRAETIREPEKTYCPFIYHELAGRHGTLFDNVEIESAPGVVTSHGEGTLYLLTGQYRAYQNLSMVALAERYVPSAPTLFEYLRQSYAVPEHQALIINGEDRVQEEFYTFSNHHLYGVRYRCAVLSLYRFKAYLLRQDLARADLPDAERADKEKTLAEMAAKDYRKTDTFVAGPELDAFWANWKGHYGRTGLTNPRGDRVLTALALRALKELRPRLLLVNYQDTDYVHWGNPSFYIRAITTIDEGVRELWQATQADEEYRDKTVFVVVPDCGRDNNRAAAVPYQHHFNTKSAHQIFAVVAGPKRWVPRAGGVVSRKQQQIAVTRTVGDIMSFATPHAEGESLFQHV